MSTALDILKQLKNLHQIADFERQTNKPNPQSEIEVEVFGVKASMSWHLWTNTEVLKYSGEHKPTKLIAYIMRPDKSSYEDLIVVNRVGISQLTIEIDAGWGTDNQPSVYVKGQRTGDVTASISDAQRKKVEQELEPIIKDLVTKFKDPIVRHNAVQYAEWSEVASILQRAIYEADSILERLDERYEQENS